MTEEEHVIQYYNFVVQLHDESFFEWEAKKIVCVDCCTNLRRLKRDITINARSKTEKFIGCLPDLHQHVCGRCCNG
jgi:hypothetical protein